MCRRTLEGCTKPYSLKQKHGDGFKRNIRFDDAETSLCIDVKLPNCSQWMTISHNHALEDRRASTKNVESRNKEHSRAN